MVEKKRVRFYFHVSSICIFMCNQSAFRSIISGPWLKCFSYEILS